MTDLRQTLIRSLAEEGVKPRLVAKNPILAAMDKLNVDQEHRHDWLPAAGEQIRRWKAEDAANGQPWGEDA